MITPAVEVGGAHVSPPTGGKSTLKSPYCASPALFAVGGFDRARSFEDELRRQKSSFAVSFTAIDGLCRLLAARAGYLFRRNWLGRFRLETSFGSFDETLVPWMEKALHTQSSDVPVRCELTGVADDRCRHALLLPADGRRATFVLMRGRKWSKPEMMLGQRIARIAMQLRG